MKKSTLSILAGLSILLVAGFISEHYQAPKTAQKVKEINELLNNNKILSDDQKYKQLFKKDEDSYNKSIKSLEDGFTHHALSYIKNNRQLNEPSITTYHLAANILTDIMKSPSYHYNLQPNNQNSPKDLEIHQEIEDFYCAYNIFSKKFIEDNQLKSALLELKTSRYISKSNIQDDAIATSQRLSEYLNNIDNTLSTLKVEEFNCQST